MLICFLAEKINTCLFNMKPKPGDAILAFRLETFSLALYNHNKICLPAHLKLTNQLI